MIARISKALVISLVLVFFLTSGVTAGVIAETEPNNLLEEANSVPPGITLMGAIGSEGDVDLFSTQSLDKYSSTLALLDLREAPAGTSAELTLLSQDGINTIAADTSSWEFGPAVILNNYLPENYPAYIRVNEAGNDQIFANYKLRYYPITGGVSAEGFDQNGLTDEPWPASHTVHGEISNALDQDCYAFEGHSGESVLLALNLAGSSLDAFLELRKLGNSTIVSGVNKNGVGGSEFLEYPTLENGIYFGCIRQFANNPGTYDLSLLINGEPYQPTYSASATQVEPLVDTRIFQGETVTYSVAITNTGPIKIPDEVHLTLDYPSCLTFVDSSLKPFISTEETLTWIKNGIPVGDWLSIEVSFEANAPCRSEMEFLSDLKYFFQVTSETKLPVHIWEHLYIPAVWND